MQALSGVDIALWDIAGKVCGQPLTGSFGGAHRTRVPVYGYGMMLRRESADALVARFVDEATEIKSMGFVATKMKVGLGVRDDIPPRRGPCAAALATTSHSWSTRTIATRRPMLSPSAARWETSTPTGSRSPSHRRITTATAS